ncbi:hypothetical protein JTB14_014824 [Gonioctena quinquepunctata]|nr:hypothetical protein JTB14_014824 [Gonioctena quinquepunctata]
MISAARFCTVRVLCVTTVVLIVILVGVLVLSFVGLPLIIDDKIAQALRLEENTEQWDRFVELPIPLDLKVFIFNVTNADEIMKGATPILDEIGPYCYKERIRRNVLSTDSTEDSVTYEQEFNITFDEQLSGNFKQTDKVIIVNPILLILSQITAVIERFVMLGCLHKVIPDKYNKLFLEIDVETIMFEGMEFAIASDDIGPACNIIREKVLEKTLPMKNVERVADPNDPNVITSLKFAFLQYKIRGPDGVYTTNRGIEDLTQLGHIMRWNHLSELPYWGRLESTNNDTCKRVRGSDSTIYPPHVTKNSEFEVFSTDICR